ncbi:MAG: putative Ig domain-containing protein [Acidobacteriota bacterium]
MTSLRLTFVTRRLRPVLASRSLPGCVIVGRRFTTSTRLCLRGCLFVVVLAMVALSGWRADKAGKHLPGYFAGLPAAASAPAAPITVNSTADAQMSEVQQVTVTGSGTFTLTFNGQTTSTLSANSFFLSSQMEGVLNALSTIGGVGGRVYVTKPGSVYVVTFGGTLATTNVPQMTATGAGGTTATVGTSFDGTTVCPGASCTLRGAIAAANAGNTIQFSSLFNSPQTITLTAGDLAVDKDLTIQGPGANLLTVSGNNVTRVFLIPQPLSPNPLLNVMISGLTIANGVAVTNSDNSNDGGGGIYNGGNLTLTDSTVSGNANSQSGQGGGIMQEPGAGGTLNIIGSTLSGNTAQRGAAICFRCGSGCTLNLANSTIAGNAASSSGGGFEMPLNGNTIINIANSTIAGNSAPTGGGIFIPIPQARINVKNSIIALNTGADVANIGGVFTSQGYNLFGTISGGATTQPTDQIGVNPLLELDGMSKPLLAFNGGPTRTVRLLPGSSALDQGASAIFSEAQAVTVSGTAGTFTLTFDGQTTNALAFNATAALVQTELNALSSIGGVGGSVTVNKIGNRYIILFGGALAGTNQPLMTAAGSGGATASVGAVVDGGGSALTTDQRSLMRPVNLASVPDASGGNGSDIGAVETQCASVTTMPASLPAALIGVAYTQDLTATGGTPPITFSVIIGSLPPGLTLNQDGTWSGAPTTLGTYNFTVLTQDAVGCGGGNHNYSITVICPTVSLTPATLPTAPAGMFYSQQLSVTPASGFSFSLTSGTLPMGILLSPSGLLSGTPTQSGTFNFRVTVASGSCSGFRDYSLVVACISVAVTPASLPGGSVGTAYNQTVSGSPSGTYSYSVTSGALPAGLSLNATTGALTGTPTTSGTFGFTVAASAGGCSGMQSYSVTIGCPAITLASLGSATVGSGYAGSVAASPAGDYTYSVVTGSLPSGLSLNTSSGAITGLPSTSGTQNFSLKAQDANGCSGTQSYSLVVSCPTITLSALPVPALNTPYNQTVTASPAGSYSFAVTAGALPTSLSLNSATGLLSGTPTATGAYSFTITVTGSGSCTGSRSYSGTISGGGCPTITFPALPSGTVGQAYNNYVAPTPAGVYSYVVTAGSLPPGLTLYDFLGLLNGYPTLAGTYNFTIQATDMNGCVGTRSYNVVIN